LPQVASDTKTHAYRASHLARPLPAHGLAPATPFESLLDDGAQAAPAPAAQPATDDMTRASGQQPAQPADKTTGVKAATTASPTNTDASKAVKTGLSQITVVTASETKATTSLKTTPDTIGAEQTAGSDTPKPASDAQPVTGPTSIDLVAAPASAPTQTITTGNAVAAVLPTTSTPATAPGTGPAVAPINAAIVAAPAVNLGATTAASKATLDPTAAAKAAPDVAVAPKATPDAVAVSKAPLDTGAQTPTPDIVAAAKTTPDAAPTPKLTLDIGAAPQADAAQSADATTLAPKTVLNADGKPAANDTDKDAVTVARNELLVNSHRATPADALAVAAADPNSAAAATSPDAAQSIAVTAPPNAAAAPPASPAPAAPPIPSAVAIPIAGLPVEIAGKAMAGMNRFEIRLDPPELGRIEVRLDVDEDGSVTSRVLVDRADTLDLLRRDANGLERALQDAGLKTADNGLQFSLRDQSMNQGQANGGSDSARLVVKDDAPATIDTPQPTYSRLATRVGGLDIRV
jgi:flagellar hook-length control protein FliK